MTSSIEYEEECAKCGYRFQQVYDKVDQATCRACPRCNDRLCNQCQTVVWNDRNMVYCVCHKYGNTDHESMIWCSDVCMDKDHPDGYDQEEEQ